MILLITNKRDLTTDYIVRELSARNIEFFRVNTEDLTTNSVFVGIQHRNDWFISVGERKVFGNQVTSAYFRRPGSPSSNLGSSETGTNTYVNDEWNALLKTIYWRLGNRWLNSPEKIFFAEDKPKQLLLAKEMGFRIPDSCVTNDINTVIEFQQNKELIAKPLKHALLVNSGKESVIFTSRIPSLDPTVAASLKLAPVIFQSEIKKKSDIRVTVVGDSVFACSINSQLMDETSVDWRKGSRTDISHEPIQLPIVVESMCIKLTKILDLNFSAIDLICDKDDEYWFLEINPNGQWAWIENRTQQPISRAIVDLLLSISSNNQNET